MHIRSTSLIISAILLLAGACPAMAAGFMIRENSSIGVGMAYAGAGSLAESAATAYANPAGIMRLSQDEMEAGIGLIIPSFEFKGSASVFGAPIPGDSGGNAGRVAAIPNLYGTFSLTDDLKAGIALTVPFGNATNYGSTWSGRYLATRTSAVSYDINPNLAWRLSDSVSIGAGFSAQYFKLDVTSAIAQSIIFQAPVPDAFNRFNGHDWAFGFNLGLLAQIDESNRIGITYRSGVDHDLEGSLNFTGASPLLGLISGPAHSEANLPGTVGVSLTHEVDPDLTLSADVQFTHWSVFRDIVVQSANPPAVYKQNYRDTWMIAAGARYVLNPEWTLRAGLAWDETPVTSAFRTVNLPDTDHFLLAIGSSWQIGDGLTLDGAYQHSIAFARPNMNGSANNTDPITHVVTLRGQYDVNVDILSFSVRYRF